MSRVEPENRRWPGWPRRSLSTLRPLFPGRLQSGSWEPLGRLLRRASLPMTAGQVRGSGGSLWARQDLNLRPLACEASALPLSYAPVPTKR
jgi:hypothetical protein